jgi:hypothetical protein
MALADTEDSRDDGAGGKKEGPRMTGACFLDRDAERDQIA